MKHLSKAIPYNSNNSYSEIQSKGHREMKKLWKPRPKKVGKD